MRQLQAAQAAEESDTIVESRMQALRMCPYCRNVHVVRHGQAHGLQCYRCRSCAKTFNPKTRTPLARLRHRDRWLAQTPARIDGLSITEAAQQMQVARSSAFRWRHRFLALPQHVKATSVEGIVQADETCLRKPFKGH